ncbi:MAG: hypothetical protein J6X28_00185 [Bacilli bacterium]|nr:hypothetical protein [Bacilli bacterium]
MDEKTVVVRKIDLISSSIRGVWNEINMYDITQLQESWNDSLCDEYVKKIQNVDRTVTGLVKELEVLRSYWMEYLPSDEMDAVENKKETDEEKENE